MVNPGFNLGHRGLISYRFPTVFAFKEHGRPTVEDGQMTFVLHRGPAGWKIRAWTWTGSKPHPAK